MGLISRSDFSTGDIPTASLWNTNFNDAYNVINGNLSDVNLASNAVTTAKIANDSVTQDKLGVMEYVMCFSYNAAIAASAENLRQWLCPYDATATKIELRTGHENSAFAIDLGKADINSSSIGSSFFTAGSANVTASASMLSVSALSNTIITAGSKIILTAKTFSANCGQPLMVNLFMNVGS